MGTVLKISVNARQNRPGKPKEELNLIISRDFGSGTYSLSFTHQLNFWN